MTDAGRHDARADVIDPNACRGNRSPRDRALTRSRTVRGGAIGLERFHIDWKQKPL
jgi:hypothetical protein